MLKKTTVLVALFVGICGWSMRAAFAVESWGEAASARQARNAPQDKPIHAQSNDQVQKLEDAVKPYVEKAKQTYPQAKKRFLAGLPPGEKFFITTKIREDSLRFEIVFIAVKQIKNGRISGLIWNDLSVVKKYKNGDEYSFPEKDLMDWTITKPDGSEEGNVVGKFLDSYQKD